VKRKMRLIVIPRKVNVYVAVDFFISVNFCFSFNVLNSLAYITIPQNNGKIKIN